MGAVKSSLMLNDGMTATLRKINNAMNIVLNSFEAVQKASGQTFDTSNIAAARQEIGQANAMIEEMEQSYRECNNQQNALNKQITEGTSAAGGLLNTIKGIAATYLGMKGVNWVKDSLSLFDTQQNAETQLKTVLNNMGVAGDAFDNITKKASELSKVTVFGDETLIGGAAEFATYMDDDKAIAVMMDTLTNYAAGMSGGGEVGYTEMVDYATGLGKIMTGSFDAMTKKGFEFTDQQKEIIENGTDMQKALVISDVVNESWANLGTQMANTPNGSIIQLNNDIGDMREELAERVYPTVMQLFNTIKSNNENISNIIVGLAKPINFVLVLATKLVNAFASGYEYVHNHWGQIAPIVYGIAGAFSIYNAALAAHKGYLMGAAVAQGIKTVAEYAHANAVLKSAEAAGVNTAALGAEGTAAALAAAGLTAEQIATAKATVAQGSFNTALLACPITWIIVGLIAIIAIVYAVVAAINKAQGTTISATGVIVGFIMAAGALILDIVIGVINGILQLIWAIFVQPFIGIIEWVLTAADGGFTSFGGAVANLIGQIISWFLSLAKVVTSVIDTIFGTDWSAGLSSLQDKVTAWGTNENAVKFDIEVPQIDRIGLGDAYSFGYSLGGKIDDKISSMFSGVNTDDPFEVSDYTGMLGDTLGDISDYTGSIADNTSKTSQELSYLRDIAEKEAINRFTTAEIKVDMTGMTNRIEGGMDIDGIISYLTEGVTEALVTAGEGVY